MDAIHPDDEDTIISMIGTLPEDVETEYMKWLRMKHRGGESGRLGTVPLVCMLRSLGYGPPEPKRRAVSTDGVVRWRSVKEGSKVSVMEDGDVKVGTYVGKSVDGTIAIIFPDTGFIYEYSPKDVTLLKGLPEDIDEESMEVIEDAVDARMQSLDDSFEDDKVEYDEISMENDWGAVEVGDRVMYGEDEDTYEGTFVCIGPKDFEVTILHSDGEKITLPEEIVEIYDAADGP